MASVFIKEILQKSVIEIVKDSLDVDAEGTVRFHSRTGGECLSDGATRNDGS